MSEQKLADYQPVENISVRQLLDHIIGNIKANGIENPVVYDLGCGKNKAEGFLGVDFYTGTDVQHDLFNGSWDFTPDGSVDFFYSSHFVEHVPDWNRFWERVYAKLKPGGFVLVTTPYGSSPRAHQDPDHKQIIFPERYWYTNAGARERMGTGHYLHDNTGRLVFFDFDILEVWPVWNEKYAYRVANNPALAEDFKERVGAIDDLTVLLRKKGDA